MNSHLYRTWIELDRKAIHENYQAVKKLLGDTTKVMAVVKSNAYGHGLVDFSKEVVAAGVEWLGVDSVVEGLRLRKEGITIPILVLGYTLPVRVQEAIDHNISLTLSNIDALADYVEVAKGQTLKVHVKADTGLHRQGFLLNQLDQVLEQLKQHPELQVEGLYTHFAKAKDANDRVYTDEQLRQFHIWIDAFKAAGLKPIVHAAASASTLLYPEARFDLVRCGAFLYGLWPSPQTEHSNHQPLHLKPVLTWKTILVEIKNVPKGSGISYDLTETVERDSRIAVCPIGYWHGFARSLSSKGQVLVGGKRAKVLGRVAMDMIIIDLTDIHEAKVGDEVVLIGHQGNETITVEEFAERSGMYVNENLIWINPLIKKIFI